VAGSRSVYFGFVMAHLVDMATRVLYRVVCGPRRMRDIGMGSLVDVCPFVEGACDMFVDNG